MENAVAGSLFPLNISAITLLLLLEKAFFPILYIKTLKNQSDDVRCRSYLYTRIFIVKSDEQRDISNKNISNVDANAEIDYTMKMEYFMSVTCFIIWHIIYHIYESVKSHRTIIQNSI